MAMGEEMLTEPFSGRRAAGENFFIRGLSHTWMAHSIRWTAVQINRTLTSHQETLS